MSRRGDCESCVDGACESECDECQHCENGSCSNSCTDCQKCVDGFCEDDSPGECQNCVNGDCISDDSECSGCQSCQNGNCKDDNSKCPDCQYCDDGECKNLLNTCDTCSNDSGSCSKEPDSYCIGNELTAGNITEPSDNDIIPSGQTVSLSATSVSDTDCYYYTSANGCFTCSESQDDPVSITWTAKWENSGNPAGEFTNNTGESASWDAPNGPGVVELTATWSNNGNRYNESKSKTIEVMIVNVVSCSWETYNTNTSLDDCPRNGGKRIYPGKKSYEDGNPGDRKKVAVKATIMPALQNQTVYFSWWDVDDPCSNTAPLDDNGSTGNDNKGSGENLSATSATTDADGVAEVTFTVSMQPGDNYKIAASAYQNQLDKVTQAMADGDESLPDNVVISEMLTTWRKLWIERDYMEPVPNYGDEKNWISGTAESYTYDSGTNTTEINLGQDMPTYFNDEDQFEGGVYLISG